MWVRGSKGNIPNTSHRILWSLGFLLLKCKVFCSYLIICAELFHSLFLRTLSPTVSLTECIFFVFFHWLLFGPSCWEREVLARGIQLGAPPPSQFQEDTSKCNPTCKHQWVSTTKCCLLNTDVVLDQHLMGLNPLHGDYKLESWGCPGDVPLPGVVTRRTSLFLSPFMAGLAVTPHCTASWGGLLSPGKHLPASC